jgi:hypothetical protein
MSYRHLKATIQRQEKAKERFQLINNNSDVCNIYYDLIVTNDFGPVVPLSFSQNRENFYLDRPDDYNVSVTYLSLDSTSIPLQVVQPQIGSSYSNGFPTIFGGVVRGKAIDSSPIPIQFTVNWLSEDSTLPIPSSPITNANYNDPYFYNFSYTHFLNLLNNAIFTACSLINLIGQTVTAPYFSFDPVTKRFSYNTNFNNFSDGTGNFVYFNEALYSLFDGLPYEFESTPVDNLGNFQNLYRLYSNLNPGYTNAFTQYTLLTNTPLVPSYNAVQMEQNFSSLETWNPVVSIVFIAKNLNVINTLEALPYVFGYNPNPNQNNASVSNILFEIPIRKRIDPGIYYEPLPEYTLTNLLGIVETGELQFDVFWKDTFGNLNIVNLDVGSTLVMRLLFRKKDFNY